jgi:hypothetical protein
MERFTRRQRVAILGGIGLITLKNIASMSRKTRPWILRRLTFGAHHHLMEELRKEVLYIIE